MKQKFERAVSSNLCKGEFDQDDLSESLTNLQGAVTAAATLVLPPKQAMPLRKRQICRRTKELYKSRRVNFSRMSTPERRNASRAIMNSCREDYRSYVDGVLNDMENTEATDNIREVSRLTKVLVAKSNQQ